MLSDHALNLLESAHVHSILFQKILEAMRDRGFFVPNDAVTEVERFQAEVEKIAGEDYVATWRKEQSMPARPPLAYFVLLIASHLRHDDVPIYGMHG